MLSAYALLVLADEHSGMPGYAVQRAYGFQAGSHLAPPDF